MSDAYKCDRCGKFYEKNEFKRSQASIQGGIITGIATMTYLGVDEWFDLCDDCMKEFEKFMSGNPELLEAGKEAGEQGSKDVLMPAT